GLARDGATYGKVTERVKLAVYGAVYAKTALNGIKNDYGVFFWCNRSYKQNDKRIAYSFKIPWGYFNVWRSYWG
ncbi:MAG: fibronectin type III domain-containing protein, partial [Oscillospiraceae bacterium]